MPGSEQPRSRVLGLELLVMFNTAKFDEASPSESRSSDVEGVSAGQIYRSCGTQREIPQQRSHTMQQSSSADPIAQKACSV